jgi:ABC-type lipoprotein export system ATPase subunit
MNRSDGPTAALDKDATRNVVFRDMLEENGTAILMVAHYHWIVYLADRRRPLFRRSWR